MRRVIVVLIAPDHPALRFNVTVYFRVKIVRHRLASPSEAFKMSANSARRVTNRASAAAPRRARNQRAGLDARLRFLNVPRTYSGDRKRNNTNPLVSRING